MCEKLRYPCRFQQRGCTARLPPAELDGHEQTVCLYRDSPCRVPRCSWRGLDSQLRAHARAAHASLSKHTRTGAAVTVRVPVWSSSLRHCRLLDTQRHVFFVHFLVDSRWGCGPRRCGAATRTVYRGVECSKDLRRITLLIPY